MLFYIPFEFTEIMEALSVYSLVRSQIPIYYIPFFVFLTVARGDEL